MHEQTSAGYVLQEVRIAENQLTASLFMPKDLVYFDGHFDEIPLLPGVVQLHWAIDLGRQYLSIPGEFSAVMALKFTRVITPESVVELNLSYLSSKGVMEFTYVSARGVHSAGKVQFI